MKEEQMDNIKIIIETPVGSGNASCEFLVNGKTTILDDMTEEQKKFTIESMCRFAILFSTK